MVSFPSGWAGGPATRERSMAQVPGLSHSMGFPTRVRAIERNPGALFYSPEYPPSYFHILVEGRVSVARLTGDGKRLVTDVLQPGDVFGNLSLDDTPSDDDSELAEAVTRCRALVLDSRDARALLASDPELALRILSAVARRLRAASERLEELVFRPAAARVAAALLRIAGDSGRAAPVSHQVLADIAGTYRETASRVLGDLQDRGILGLGRCAIEIRDARLLAGVAGG